MSEDLQGLGDQELVNRIERCDRESDRISRLSTVDDVATHVRTWIDAARAKLGHISAESLDDHRLILLSLTVSNEIEAAMVERLSRGVTTQAQVQQSVDALDAERDGLHAERARRRASPGSHRDRVLASGETRATAGVEIFRGASVFQHVNGTQTPLPLATEWFRRIVRVQGDWAVKADLVSGDTPTGPSLGRWISFKTQLHWQLIQSGPGRASAKLAVSLTRTSGSPNPTIASTAIFELVAEVQAP